jgi:hypothetical protein
MTYVSIPYELMKSSFHMTYYCQIVAHEVCDQFIHILSYKLCMMQKKCFRMFVLRNLKECKMGVNSKLLIWRMN